jgi:hypothetical protein
MSDNIEQFLVPVEPKTAACKFITSKTMVMPKPGKFPDVENKTVKSNTAGTDNIEDQKYQKDASIARALGHNPDPPGTRYARKKGQSDWGYSQPRRLEEGEEPKSDEEVITGKNIGGWGLSGYNEPGEKNEEKSASVLMQQAIKQAAELPSYMSGGISNMYKGLTSGPTNKRPGGMMNPGGVPPVSGKTTPPVTKGTPTPLTSPLRASKTQKQAPGAGGSHNPANQQPDAFGRSPYDPNYDPNAPAAAGFDQYGRPAGTPPGAHGDANSDGVPDDQQQQQGVFDQYGRPAGTPPGAHGDANSDGVPDHLEQSPPAGMSAADHQKVYNDALAGGVPNRTQRRAADLSAADRQEYSDAISGFGGRDRSELSPQDQQEFDQAGAPFGINKGGSAPLVPSLRGIKRAAISDYISANPWRWFSGEMARGRKLDKQLAKSKVKKTTTPGSVEHVNKKIDKGNLTAGGSR